MVGIAVNARVVDWENASLDSSDVNLLLLSDRLRDCHSNRLRLRI
jgi:hypothetical protein